MTRTQAANLLAGDVVCWRGDASDVGDVIATESGHVAIDWRRPGIPRDVLDVGDMHDVEPITMHADRERAIFESMTRARR